MNNHRMRTMRTREARVGFIAALVACALTFAVTSLFDPFGTETNRAERVATGVAAYNLCINRDTFEGVAELIPDGTTAHARLVDSVRRLNEAAKNLEIDCPEVKAVGPQVN